jgi:IS30 family transposase
MRKKRIELDLHERQLIYKMHQNRLSYREIDKRLGRNHTVIRSELMRNKPPAYLAKHYDSYERAKYANDKAEKRRKCCKFR